MLETKTKNIENLLAAMEGEINAIVDKIISNANISDDPFHSIKNRKREELFANLGGGEYWQRIPNGFKLIGDDLRGHLSPQELKAQELELEHAMDKVESLNQQKCASVDQCINAIMDTPESFQELFGISDQTIEHFYQAGARYYQAGHFKEASDVFYVISFLNPYLFNVWLSLGMAEEQAHHYTKALEAFAMAAIVDMTSVIPLLHSAHCYILLGDHAAAKATLEFASQTLQAHPTDRKQADEQQIQNLKGQILNK